MPIYEYRCTGCGLVFDRLVRLSSLGGGPATQRCPSCAGAGRRLFSSVALLGRADPGLGTAAHPTAWEQTAGADPAVVGYWQRRIEREQVEEARDPELATLRRAAADREWARRSTAGQDGSAPIEPPDGARGSPTGAVPAHPHRNHRPASGTSPERGQWPRGSARP